VENQRLETMVDKVKFLEDFAIKEEMEGTVFI
jgi:hypothetical protein